MTMLVKRVCEMMTGETQSTGFKQKKELISQARADIFDFDYPIFDEAYRPVIESKILNHYYMREICAETVGLWQHYLDITLNEVMPYYNQLYKSELLSFNPLYDVDVTKTYTLKSDGKTDKVAGETSTKTDQTLTDITADSTNERSEQTVNDSTQNVNTDTSAHTDGDTTSSEWSLDLDTPQGAVTSLYSVDDNPSGSYLTTAQRKTGKQLESTDATGESASETTAEQTVDVTALETDNRAEKHDTKYTSTGAVDSTDVTKAENLQTYSERVQGKNAGGSYANLITEFRNTFLNIDQLLLKDLESCFYGLW